MSRWVMVIDLRKCIGCATCAHVCSYGNEVPPGSHWRKLIERTVKNGSAEERVFVSVGCMHCEAPPCREVCPTGATYRREDGIVAIRGERCMGCGACITACPYGARVIADQDVGGIYEDILHPDAHKDRIGICTKCDFCFDRITKAIYSGQKPGSVLDATPYCAWYCISDAIVFGDAHDSKSEVAKLLTENQSVRLEEDLETNPSVYYIIE